MGDWVNSLCAIYAELIENELQQANSNKEQIIEWLHWIKENCHTLATPKGEIPEQLRQYLIKKGEGKGVTGVTVVAGKLMPKVAAAKRKGKKFFDAELKLQTEKRGAPGIGYVSSIYRNQVRLGYIEYFPLKQESGLVVFLNYVYIEPSVRGGELFSLLFEEVEQKAGEFGIDRIVVQPIIGMKKFWTLQGFVYINERNKSAGMYKLVC